MKITIEVPDLHYAKEIADLILDAAAEHDFKATEASELELKVPDRHLSPRRKDSLLRFYRRRQAEQSDKAEALHRIFLSIREQIEKLEGASLR